MKLIFNKIRSRINKIILGLIKLKSHKQSVKNILIPNSLYNMNKRFTILLLLITILSTVIIVIKYEAYPYKNKNRKVIDSLLVSKLFPNFDFQNTYVFIDDTIQAQKHAASVPGILKLNKIFYSEDSTTCILLTASPNYFPIEEQNETFKSNCLNPIEDTIQKRHHLIVNDCHACGVQLGYYQFTFSNNRWNLFKEYPKFIELGAWAKAPANIQIKNMAKNKFALFIEANYSGQGERNAMLSIFCPLDNKMKEIFNEQIYYSNEGAVGKPIKILSNQELNSLSQYDQQDYLRSCEFYEEKSTYQLVKKADEFYQIKITTTHTDYQNKKETQEQIFHFNPKTSQYE